ncbi:MAG: D-aminoacylase [Chthoniobacterales bacterium]|nr:D-aminoacylase [Chthoniobacterales bacterium]
MIRLFSCFCLAIGTVLASLHAQPPTAEFDLLIKGGTVYDGTGGPPARVDGGITGDRIAAVGKLPGARPKKTIEAKGLAVAPGFINMLSWSTESLIEDGRSQSEIRQGVTTEIMGEGESMGPLNDRMKERFVSEQKDIKYAIEWSTLSEYLAYLEKRGVSPNVASFIGATTLREHAVGLEDKPATPAQLDEMRELVRREMAAGALGIGSSLIYAPAFYASTEELIELCKVAAEYQGKYISHLRSEGAQLLEALEELIRISREARIPAEVYHLKAAGQENWKKMDRALEMIEEARRDGLKITADMYLYPAAGTGLNACLPPSALQGGYEALFERLRNPEERRKIAEAVRTPTTEWENFYLATGSPERILVTGFKNEKLKPLTGKSLADVAKKRGTDPVDTIMDLMLEDGSRVDAIYFLMSEKNISKQLRKPWVSLGSDEASAAPEGVFLKANPHPRAFGNFARLLGKYVREEKTLTLAAAVHRVSGLPATNLGLDGRGFIKEGMFADIAIFDPAQVADRATFAKPHQYAVGMKHVFVNGVQVLADGEHTGAKPGRALAGPGKTD